MYECMHPRMSPSPVFSSMLLASSSAQRILRTIYDHEEVYGAPSLLSPALRGVGDTGGLGHQRYRSNNGFTHVWMHSFMNAWRYTFGIYSPGNPLSSKSRERAWIASRFRLTPSAVASWCTRSHWSRVKRNVICAM